MVVWSMMMVVVIEVVVQYKMNGGYIPTKDAMRPSFVSLPSATTAAC
jgi:hypothetical protein